MILKQIEIFQHKRLADADHTAKTLHTKCPNALAKKINHICGSLRQLRVETVNLEYNFDPPITGSTRLKARLATVKSL